MKIVFNVLFVVPALLLASCGDDTKNPGIDSAVVSAPVDSTLITTDSGSVASPNAAKPFGGDTTIACYYFNEGEDHRRMYVMRTGNYVLGDLHINWEGKDGAMGSFIGSFSGDTMWANYDVVMEGQKMRQEIVFILKDNQMIQGYGELNEDAAVQSFINKKKITFDEKHAMAKGDCN